HRDLPSFPTRRSSDLMADELEILRTHLSTVAPQGSRWAARIARLVDAADRLGAAIPEPTPRGIHRDFYADQVIVDGQRLFLLDLDRKSTRLNSSHEWI